MFTVCCEVPKVCQEDAMNDGMKIFDLYIRTNEIPPKIHIMFSILSLQVRWPVRRYFVREKG